MAQLKTSKGYLEYDSQLLYFGAKVLVPEIMLDNLKILALYLDKIDINWGPAFGTLIGIIRNDDFPYVSFQFTARVDSFETEHLIEYNIVCAVWLTH